MILHCFVSSDISSGKQYRGTFEAATTTSSVYSWDKNDNSVCHGPSIMGGCFVLAKCISLPVHCANSGLEACTPDRQVETGFQRRLFASSTDFADRLEQHGLWSWRDSQVRCVFGGTGQFTVPPPPFHTADTMRTGACCRREGECPAVKCVGEHA